MYELPAEYKKIKGLQKGRANRRNTANSSNSTYSPTNNTNDNNQNDDPDNNNRNNGNQIQPKWVYLFLLLLVFPYQTQSFQCPPQNCCGINLGYSIRMHLCTEICGTLSRPRSRKDSPEPIRVRMRKGNRIITISNWTTR